MGKGRCHPKPPPRSQLPRRPPRRPLLRRLPLQRKLPLQRRLLLLRRALPRSLPPRRLLLPRRHLPRRPLPRRLLPRRPLPRRPPRKALPRRPPRRNKFALLKMSCDGIGNILNVEKPDSMFICNRAFPFFFQFVTCLVVKFSLHLSLILKTV